MKHLQAVQNSLLSIAKIRCSTALRLCLFLSVQVSAEVYITVFAICWLVWLPVVESMGCF